MNDYYKKNELPINWKFYVHSNHSRKNELTTVVLLVALMTDKVINTETDVFMNFIVLPYEKKIYCEYRHSMRKMIVLHIVHC